MSFEPKADCAIIGGDDMERTVFAIKVRQSGFSCFTEFKSRKRQKMFKRACDENRWGNAGVYDLDDPEDREWLSHDDLNVKGV